MNAPLILLDRSFEDVFQLAEWLPWELDFRQIERGPLLGHARVLNTAWVNIIRIEFDRGFHQVGAPPPGAITVGFPDTGCVPLSWKHHQTSPDTMLNFCDGDQMDGTNRTGFGGYTVSFEETRFLGLADALGVRKQVSRAISSIPFWDASGDRHTRMRDLLQCLDNPYARMGDMPLPGWTEWVARELANGVIGIICDATPNTELDNARTRRRVLSSALSLIDDPEQPTHKVENLCAAVGTSIATLERAFREEFDIGPREYLLARRLTGVRRDINKEPDRTLTDIAGRWGFTHLGRFSAYYRRHFGELPSETARDLLACRR